MTRVVFLPSARDDLRRAQGWYREQRRGLGREFRDEVDRVLAIIAENPRFFALTYRGVRRAITKRFPYKIFYEQRSGVTQVLAVRHQSQRPVPGLEKP